MWDIGGQESLRQAWSTYYTGTQFLLLVVDSTDRERLSVAKEELYRMLGHEVRLAFDGRKEGIGEKVDWITGTWLAPLLGITGYCFLPNVLIIVR